jgi:HK97 family phage prohead protease
MDKLLRFKGLLAKGADGVYQGIASTSEIDRDGEIVQASSFTNLDRIVKEQGPIYFQHAWGGYGPPDETKMPVGKIVGAVQSPSDLKVSFVFATGGPMTFAPKVQWMVDHGFLKHMSIGAIPIKWETDNAGHRVYTQLELLEVSVVGIPSNRGAIILNEMKAAGYNISKDEEKLILEVAGGKPEGAAADGTTGWAKLLAKNTRSKQ